jgi:hypothetical protein
VNVFRECKGSGRVNMAGVVCFRDGERPHLFYSLHVYWLRIFQLPAYAPELNPHQTQAEEDPVRAPPAHRMPGPDRAHPRHPGKVMTDSTNSTCVARSAKPRTTMTALLHR